MLRKYRLAVCVLGLFAATTVRAELDEAEFERLHQLLSPTPATWREIPWRTNLLKAQQRAVEENKPIFIWAMDGHPLGCT